MCVMWKSEDICSVLFSSFYSVDSRDQTQVGRLYCQHFRLSHLKPVYLLISTMKITPVSHSLDDTLFLFKHAQIEMYLGRRNRGGLFST